MKRIVLFLLTNLAVLLVVLRLLGLDRVVASQGYGYGQLLAFSAVVGFTGAIISLLMSKTMAKWSTGAHVIELDDVRTRAPLGHGLRHQQRDDRAGEADDRGERQQLA